MYIIVSYMVDGLPHTAGMNTEVRVSQGSNHDARWYQDIGTKELLREIVKRHPLGRNIIIQSVIIPKSSGLVPRSE